MLVTAAANLKEFSCRDLEIATGNFSGDNLLAEGGSGIVYKGWVHDETTMAPSSSGIGMLVAIKKYNPDRKDAFEEWQKLSSQHQWRVYKGWVHDETTMAPSSCGIGMPVAIKKYNPDRKDAFEEWQSEVNILGRHYHPNLVGILGYCWEDENLFLIYEFIENRSLNEHLFRRVASEPLAWDIRLKIAIGAARGLTFLHTLEKKVLCRDFNTWNILLDENYNAKLTDFSLATLVPSGEEAHFSPIVAGTIGYIAPEYITTGELYLKSDVYSFGVVLLELLMGLRVTDPEHPSKQQNLVDWLEIILSQETKLKTIMDVRMEGQYLHEAALQATQLSLKCLAVDPQSRPSMKQVVEVLKEIEAQKDETKELQN